MGHQIETFSGWGQLVRVRYVEDDRWIHVQLFNGSAGWVEAPEPVNYDPGTTLLLVDGRIEEAPEEAWPDESWVAVVRIKRADTTVVEASGQTRMVPTNAIQYDENNTVEVRSSGVVRVLSEKPLRLIDLPDVDESVVTEFIVQSGEKRLTFDDFGGLVSVVDRARELIETPLKYRESLERIGAKRIKGVLFTGDPGTGKTMLAKIIAQESDATFYHISGPEVISKWYGQSEELLRKLFEHAATKESAIIFFDEIDSVAAQRDEDAHEASRRLVAQLLTLMDGFTESNVVVIATTNRPQDIDTALRRPGRFDWEIHFPCPDRDDRLSILRASSRHLQTLDFLPLSVIADQTESWTAADLSAVWTEAALLAAVDGREAIMAEDLLGGFGRVGSRRQQSAIASKDSA